MVTGDAAPFEVGGRWWWETRAPGRACWAVVVGSGGLAEAICRQLVSMHVKIILCARRFGPHATR